MTTFKPYLLAISVMLPSPWAYFQVNTRASKSCFQLNSCLSSITWIVEALILILNLDGKQLQELLDQVRQRATAAEEALEAAEERSEKYRAMIDEANIELNQFKEKV